MKLYYFFAIVFLFACFAGCSSKVSETNQAANSNLTANSSTTIATNAQTANAPVSQAPAGQNPVVVNVNPNAFNATSNQSERVVPVDPKNDKTTSGIYGRPAPDNSTFKATMDAKGMFMEIRTFNNDPYIIKVERLFTTPDKTLKIYLKSGKVVQVPEEKLPNFAAATPGDILVAAGVDIKKLQTNTEGTKDGSPVKKP